MQAIYEFLYYYFPRFITEEVGLVRLSEDNEDGEADYQIVNCLIFMEEKEIDKCDLIGRMSFFNLFGYAIFCKLDEQLIPVKEWREMSE